MTAAPEHTLREYRGDFEVHLTVAARDAAARERFREWCAAHGSKCVWIVLARGAHADQPMATWRQRHTVLPAVLAEAHSRADDLTRLAIPVTRVKIETAPHNRDIPTRDEAAAEHGPNNYFEHHIKVLRPTTAPRDALIQLCERFGAHLSRNAFREPAAGLEERFVTLRAYGVGAASSDRQFRRLLDALRDSGERILEHESEYCVYDSAVELDAGWLAPMN